MSGHNKWSQIKHKKGAEDAKRSRLFAELVRAITTAARESGGDHNNLNLKKAVERAKTANMPNKNIERAIEAASGASGAALKENLYEAYGPGGAALLIKTTTDNTTRTVNELKHLLSETGGNLATPGSAAWAFQQNADGSWQTKSSVSLDSAAEEKLKHLIETLTQHDDVQAVFTNADYRS